MMPVRTFQRRLAEHRMSFSRVAGQARFEAARQLLTRSDLPLAVISDKLGYSDYTKFSRAFAGWAGQTPRQYRLAERS